MPNVAELKLKLQYAEAALAFAERKNREQSEIITDLLLLLGSRTTCAKCNIPVFWIVVRDGPARMFNPDGSEHWPRCKRTPRPQEAVAVGGE